MSKRTISLLLVLLAMLLALPVAAQDIPDSIDTSGITDDDVNEVAKEVYCPVCESTPLDVCATQACADWREVIRGKLAEGQSEQEIFDYFARQYGDGVLASPPRRGTGLLLWLFPIFAVVVGGVFFVRYMRNLQTDDDIGPVVADANTAVASTAPAKDDYLSRVEQELRNK